MVKEHHIGPTTNRGEIEPLNDSPIGWINPQYRTMSWRISCRWSAASAPGKAAASGQKPLTGHNALRSAARKRR